MWELPMSSDGEYDGVSVVTGESVSGIPAEADRILMYHLVGNGEITGGSFKHTALEGKAVMFDLEHEARAAMLRDGPRLAPDAEVRPGLETSGTPSFLCVYRLVSQKSTALRKSAKR